MAHQSTNYSAQHEAPTQEPRSSFDPLQIGIALLSRLPPGQNSVISPLSIASLLSMLYSGSRGHTRRELEMVLHMSTEAVDRSVDDFSQLQCYRRDSGTRFTSSSGAFVASDAKIESDYSEQLDRLAARVTLMNFADQPEVARQQINAWIADETGGLIKNLFSHGAVDINTALVLANAVYFKGAWRKPFDTHLTKDGAFTLASGKRVTTKLMEISSTFLYAMDKARQLELLRLPYGDDTDLSMLILLPFEGASLDACLHQNLSSPKLAELVARMTSMCVRVELPKFSVSSLIDVKESLNALGIESLFSCFADLSGICRNLKLGVSSCVHRVLIDVSEEGTIAAATSGFLYTLGKPSLPPPMFACTRPFIFAIWHSPSAAALFFGRVDDPTLRAEM